MATDIQTNKKMLERLLLDVFQASSSFCMDNKEEREALADSATVDIMGRFFLTLKPIEIATSTLAPVRSPNGNWGKLEMTLEQWQARRQEFVGKELIIKGHKRHIRDTYPDIIGGVLLDEPIGDFRSWNIDEEDE